MNLRKLFFRDRPQTSVNVFEAWEVRWISRHGSYSSDTRKEIRVFLTEGDAKEFRDALLDAFALIGATAETKVALEKQKPLFSNEGVQK